MGTVTQYLTPQEVCDHFDGRIKVKTLANWRCGPSGKGPPFRRLGNKILYPRDQLEAWERASEFRSTRDYGRPVSERMT